MQPEAVDEDDGGVRAAHFSSERRRYGAVVTPDLGTILAHERHRSLGSPSGQARPGAFPVDPISPKGQHDRPAAGALEDPGERGRCLLEAIRPSIAPSG